MKAPIGRTLIAGIVVAIAGVLAIVIISLRMSMHMQDTAAMVKHTNQVLYKTQEVSDLTTWYELAVKNFLLTGDSSFLDTLDNSSSQLYERIAELGQLVSDNPVQQTRIDSLLHDVFKNRVFLGVVVGMHGDGPGAGRSRTRDGRPARELLAASSAIGYSRQIRTVLDSMKSEERRLLDQRRKANLSSSRGLQWVLWGLFAAVALLALVIFQKVRIDLGEERAVSKRLSLFNDELEQRVRTQTADLHASGEKYKTLFYKSPLPKWIYDQETLRIMEVNDAAIIHYGYSQEEFFQMTIADIRPPEDGPDLLQDVASAVSGTDEYQNRRWRHIKKNGELIFVEITAHAFEYEGRKTRMVVVNDITERTKYEELLNRMNADLTARAAELAASNAELERFAYIASHDLQEPLRMVSSFLQLLKKKYGGQLDEKADQYIHYAVDGSERMKVLIKDLLDYSRVGAAKVVFSPVDTGMIMGEVGDIFREEIIKTRARIEIDPLPTVGGDKGQLMQLFLNIVGNALKYHSEELPVINITAKETPGFWQFTIRDNGIGIDSSFFEKIFIVFQRLHNKSDYSGTGIGLAICKKIVERHGGRIWVESAPGKGSAFSFTLAKTIKS